jgi:hypothetical protein
VQAAPSAFATIEHAPVFGSQVPGSWHSSLVAQVTGLPALHLPDWQASSLVQRSSSSQLVPSASLTGVQPPLPSQDALFWQGFGLQE